MSDPIIAAKHPEVLELEPGKKYAWCRCGRSESQPYCDGSHAGTGMEPLVFEVESDKRYALCLCKATERSPFCDGTHKRL